MRRAAAVALVVLAVAPAAAERGPALALRIDAAGCAFAADAAHQAVSAELTLPAELQATAERVTVRVTCPDETTAVVAVSPAPADRPLERRIELGELREDLRLRLVALVVAELVAIAAGVEPAPAPPGVAAMTSSVTAPASVNARASAPSIAREHAAPGLWQRRAVVGDSVARGDIHARGGVRVFAARTAPMLDVGAGARRGPFTVDVFAATVSRVDVLGSVRGTVAGAGLSAALACRGERDTAVCIGGRAAAGVARLDGDPLHMRVISAGSTDSFVEVGPRIDVRLEAARWSADLGVLAGWAWGPAALAGGREVLRLAGPVLVGSIAVGWSP